MSTAQHSFKFATRGTISALDPLLLSEQSLARATNMRLHKQLPRTRYKFREIPIKGFTPLIDEWRTLATQGATFFNPSKGLGAQAFGQDLSYIMEASDGRKFSLLINGRGSQTTAHLDERTNGVTHDPYVHLVWWTQAENYILTCDGQSDLWIWDGRTTATASTGLDSLNKENSKLPNACTVLLYIHYRIGAVNNAREIRFGDSLHKSNLSSSANLLNATEAVYYNTGQWFSPPSGMGNIMAAGPLPMRNTAHGQSEAAFHTPEGVFTTQTNLPRDEWATSAITRHALLKTGAVGPYALDLMDGDQVFRSRHGIQTLRSAAAETNTPLNPFAPLNAEVEDMMAGDAPQFLRFTSLVNFTRARRLFCTVYPMVALRHRWSKGFVVLNENPTDVVPDGSRSWEGMWTLPPQWGGVVQFVTGIFTSEERTFALCWEPTSKRKTLIEITTVEGDDELIDGSRVRIAGQLWSRAITAGDLFKSKNFVSGRLLLKDVRGVFDYGVWFRGDGEGEWRQWRIGKVCVIDNDCTTLTGKGGRDFAVPLGEVPQSDAQVYRYFQVMVRWRGIGSIESVEVQAGSQKNEDGLALPPCEECQDGKLAICAYSDFEYTSATRWEDATLEPC